MWRGGGVEGMSEEGLGEWAVEYSSRIGGAVGRGLFLFFVAVVVFVSKTHCRSVSRF